MLNLASQIVNTNVNPVYGGQGSEGSQVLFTNQSTTVTIWLGYVPTILAGQGPSIPLLPGASITVGGAITVYGVTESGTAILSVVPAGISYSSPGPFISPLFTSSGNTFITSGSSIQPILLQDVSQFSSYDLTLSVNDASQGTVNHPHGYSVQLAWFDDLTSGIPVFEETWFPWVGDVANAMPVTGNGPMHGQYLTVTITNPAGATGTITVNYLRMFASARSIQLSDWRQQANQKVDQSAHVIVNNSLVTDNMLADTNGMVALASGQTYVIFLGLYSGPMDWGMQTGVGTLSRSNLINVGSNGGVQTSGNLNPQANSLEVLLTASGQQSSGSQKMPRAGCALILTAAANTTVEFTAVAQQGP